MPTLFIEAGLRFFFYSEEHLPMHVHVQNGDGKAKFVVEPEVVLVESRGMKPADVKKAWALAELRREEIVRAWRAYHG